MDPIDRDAIRRDLVWLAEDFAELVRTADPGELGAPTDGTRWTNRQLLFHLVFGQRITRMVIPVMGGFSSLPPGASRAFSRLMAATTTPYNWLNWLGSAVGGRLVSPARMMRQMDHLTAVILRWYDRAEPAQLARGMSVPPSWDPYFLPWMNRADLLEWAPKHYRHHRAQLTLTAARSPE